MSNASTSCACEKCASLCLRNPGWFTPQEAVAALDAGHANRIMRDWIEPDPQVGNMERVYILSPASAGCEGSDAPDFDWMEFLRTGDFRKGRCAFLGADNLCELHTSGFKPEQCRLAYGCDREEKDYPDNRIMGKRWWSDEGRAVVERWQQLISQ